MKIAMRTIDSMRWNSAPSPMAPGVTASMPLVAADGRRMKMPMKASSATTSEAVMAPEPRSSSSSSGS